jgi:hypothetical protein
MGAARDSEAKTNGSKIASVQGDRLWKAVLLIAAHAGKPEGVDLLMGQAPKAKPALCWLL